VDREDGNASFLTTFYPNDYFTQIIIDDCHRSAWGKWSEVLTRNPGAVQIGLTATPRKLAEKLCKLTDRGVDPWQTPAVPEGALLAAESTVPYRVKGSEAPAGLLS
jgi:superfamily II DNA or RNA helicase